MAGGVGGFRRRGAGPGVAAANLTGTGVLRFDQVRRGPVAVPRPGPIRQVLPAPPPGPAGRRRVSPRLLPLGLVFLVAAVLGGLGSPRTSARSPASPPSPGSPLRPGVGFSLPGSGVVAIDAQALYTGSHLQATGIVLSPGGEVLTNNHVVEGAGSIVGQVVGEGPRYPARVLGTAAAADVALLQLEGAPPRRPLPLGDSVAVRAGDRVVVVGNAGGGRPEADRGRVTATGRTVLASDP